MWWKKERDKVLQELDKLIKKQKIRGVRWLVLQHMSEGEEKQQALDWLEKAEQELDSS